MTKSNILKFIIIYTLIIVFNISNHTLPSDRNNIIQSNAETGLSLKRKNFFYFDYYLNLFPLKSLINPTNKELSQSSALEKLSNTDMLVMEDGHSIRFDGFFMNYLFFFDAFIFKNILSPSIKTFNIIFFNFSLFLLLLSFFCKKKYLLGSFFCLLISNNPFQIYEVYKNENVFGNFISLLLILASFYLFLSSLDKKKNYFLFVIIYTILCLSFVSFFFFIRSYFIILVFPVFLSIFFINLNFKKKGTVIFLSIIFLIFINFFFQYLVESKFNKTKNILIEKNGRFLDVPIFFHERFFPIYVGLNEFKTNLNFGFWHDDEGNPLLAKHNIIVSDIMSKKSKNGYNLHPVGEIKNFDNYYRDEIITLIKTDLFLVPKLIYNRINYSLNNLTPIKLNIILFKTTIDNKIILKILLFFYFFTVIFILKNKNSEYLYLTILFSSGTFLCLVFPPTLGLSYYILSHYFLFSILVVKFFRLIKK